MARYVGFIVHQRIDGRPRELGIFGAAYALRDEGELPRHDHERLCQLLAWFAAELPVPPENSIPDRAIFWYKDVGPFSRHMWELVELLKENGVVSEQITAGFVGRIVYRDTYQLAAVPPRRDHR